MKNLRIAIFSIIAMLFCFALPVASPDAPSSLDDFDAPTQRMNAIKHDEEEDVDYIDDVKTRVVNVHTGTDEIVRTIYSDEIFFKDSDQYHHLLAKQSIGFARVAYSLWDEESENINDGSLMDYFESKGFTDIRVDDFDKDTSIYTIGTGIAHKEIRYGTESATLVAVGIRGNRYKNEWQSNLSLSAGFRHEGFDAAATLVTDRILSYISQHAFTSPVKVWITGFSRAGAVANLVAANLNRSSMLSRDQVYAYTFAAPQAIWLAAEEDMIEGFQNIFNILGASDMVPQIVPGEWGYARYGIDKWLPGAEFNSNFKQLYSKLQQVLKDEFDITTYYNVQLNLRLRLLMGLILELIDSDVAYMDIMQPFLVDLLANKDINSIMTLLRRTLMMWKEEFPFVAEGKDKLIDFALATLLPIVTGSGYMKGQFPTASGKIGVLFHEHYPELYHHYLYSFSADELFTDNNEFAYVVIEGNAPVEVIDASSDKTLMTIQSGKCEYEEASKELGIELPFFESAGKGVLILPYDRDYDVAYDADNGQSVKITAIPYGRMFTSEFLSFEINEKGPSSGSVLSVSAGSAAYEGEAKYIRSSDIASMLRIEKLLMNYRWLLVFAVSIVGLLIVAVVWLIEVMGSKLRHTGIAWKKTLIGSIVFLAALEGEILFWIVADMMILNIVFKIIAALGLLGLYLVDKDIKPLLKNVHRSLLPFLFLMGLGYVLTSVSSIAGMALFIAGLGYLSYYNLLRHKMSMNSWITYGVSSAVGLLLMALIFRVSTPEGIMFLVLFPFLLLSQFSSLKYEGKKAAAFYALIFAFAMLGLYFLTKYAFFPSLLFVGGLNISLGFFAGRYDEEYGLPLPKRDEESKQMPELQENI